MLMNGFNPEGPMIQSGGQMASLGPAMAGGRHQGINTNLMTNLSGGNGKVMGGMAMPAGDVDGFFSGRGGMERSMLGGSMSQPPQDQLPMSQVQQVRVMVNRWI